MCFYNFRDTKSVKKNIFNSISNMNKGIFLLSSFILCFTLCLSREKKGSSYIPFEFVETNSVQPVKTSGSMIGEGSGIFTQKDIGGEEQKVFLNLVNYIKKDQENQLNSVYSNRRRLKKGGGAPPPKRCNAGQYLSGNSCPSCPSGKYQSQNNHRNQCSNCRNCGVGTYLSGCSTTNSGSCRGCPAGKYNRYNGRNSCLTCGTCGSGRFYLGCNRNNGAVQCDTCPAGKFDAMR